MVYLVPWEPVSGTIAAGLENELTRELGRAHPLFGQPAQAIARSLECDDALYRFPDASCAVVHLTYTGSPPERPGWPSFESYRGLLHFALDRMLPDHRTRCGLD